MTKLKPSGVEWLGDIPSHWEVKRNLGGFIERNESNQLDKDLDSIIVFLDHKTSRIDALIEKKQRQFSHLDEQPVKSEVDTQNSNMA